VITYPIQKPVVFEIKKVEHQFSEFLTGPHVNALSVSVNDHCQLFIAFLIVRFSPANNSSPRRRQSTDDHSIIRDTACPISELCQNQISNKNQYIEGVIISADTISMHSFSSLIHDMRRTTFRPYAPCAPISPMHYRLWESHNLLIWPRL
jgi:hypothetical protein